MKTVYPKTDEEAREHFNSDEEVAIWIPSGEEAEEQRHADAMAHMKKEFAINASVANVIMGVREYYRDPYLFAINHCNDIIESSLKECE